MKLRQWQRDFIFAIYANNYPDGSRRTRRAILSIARKNGKTALIAALVLVHLVGPEAIMHSDILSAANSKKQAAMVFKYVKQFIALSPRLTNMLGVVESTKTVANYALGSTYTAIAADAENSHGENPVVVIFDELAQAKNRELFDALETSQDAQEEPLFITISTQSNDPQHPLSQMIDDGLNSGDPTIVCHLYEVPEDVENIFEEEAWYGANPALGDFKKIVGMQSDARKAHRLPSFEARFRNLQLNQRVSLMTTLFTRSVWTACRDTEKRLIPGERIYLALDMATTTDLCSLAVYGEQSKVLKAHFWKPEDLIEEHARRDRQDYAQWLKHGFFERCPGKTIDPELVAMIIAGYVKGYDVAGLAYDRWRIDTLTKELQRIDLDASESEHAALTLFPWGQGFKDMSPAVDAFEAAAINGDFTHNNNPALTWCITNAVVQMDPSGNRKLNKEKSAMRIDGAVAATMVIGLHARFMESDDDEGSYLDEEEIDIL